MQQNGIEEDINVTRYLEKGVAGTDGNHFMTLKDSIFSNRRYREQEYTYCSWSSSLP